MDLAAVSKWISMQFICSERVDVMDDEDKRLGLA